MQTSALYAGRPTTLILRNTFIDETVLRPPSLDEFFKEREIRSCPASPRSESLSSERSLTGRRWHEVVESTGYVTDDYEGEESTAAPQVDIRASSDTSSGDILKKLRSDGTQVLERLQYQYASAASFGFDARSAVPDGGVSLGLDWASFPENVQAWSLQWQSQLHSQAHFSCEGVPCASADQLPPPPPLAWAPMAFEFDVSTGPPPQREVPQADARILVLPSVGSALHGTGQCKPCWFVHKRGCTNGDRCELCHVCPPGEWKRRRQLRRAEADNAAAAAAAVDTDAFASVFEAQPQERRASGDDLMGLLNAAFSRFS